MKSTETENTAAISPVRIEGETFFKISNSDALRPFFMSIISDSNHWMFISSNGGLTAGRRNADYALFPYYTDDKITESAEITGSKSIFRVKKDGDSHIWEPFSIRNEGLYATTRNLYKNVYGNKIIFEEINHDLHLTFRYEWNSSNMYGFVKRSRLINQAGQEVRVSVLDGIQNVLPYGVPGDLQNSTSNLVDAYKRSELEKDTGLGIYALSAIIVDRAEPSEALKANIVWSLGLENPVHLLSSLQLSNFRKGMPLKEEEDVKGEKGAYFLQSEVSLQPGAEKEWLFVANVNQDHAAVAEISQMLKARKDLEQLVMQDVALGTERLIRLNAASDGLQLTSDHYKDARHFSNTLFNIMRGGIFDENYRIEKWDFSNYLAKANKEVFARWDDSELPEVFSLSQLKAVAQNSADKDFKRLCLEYMPLKFSRRHGDPSRPWNRFSINTRSEIDGSKILDYEGNWRDIFQNWEALAHSYPAFIESMILKFLNATTFDGYNPYRVTKDGFDWETIEPDNPWSYIGYWGDHQIIYLLKFLEFMEKHFPGKLESYFDQDFFVYANVPYRIKPYQAILENPKDTIEFDFELDKKIHEERAAQGADAALLRDENGAIHTANFIEKILATTLAKLSNFIPEGGIWMNTQRPEWNDANNALVGNGVSMVTLYYLRRFLKFFNGIFETSETKEVNVSSELLDFFDSIVATFEKNSNLLSGQIGDRERKQILDGLGQAASDFRLRIYNGAFSGEKRAITLKDLSHFAGLALQYLEHSIRANERPDRLYHAYNLMTVEGEANDAVSISHLSEMLEGQVAVLSSGYLSSSQALTLLDALKHSALFRDDQYSYILYPNKALPRFREKNNIPQEAVAGSELLRQLEHDGNLQIIEKDVNGAYHFNGNFKNANDLRAALDALNQKKYGALVQKDKKRVLQLFEQLFNHKAFTGRSGTFYGYEGLGSIYWHMVSKLLLAVQECCLKAIEENASKEVIGRLLEHYYEINEGIGVHKPPSLYGAFPTDAYSHTPAGRGAQQPGMTGQVKEDILSRFGELGVFVKAGNLCFDPCLLRKTEFLTEAKTFEYVNVDQQGQKIPLEAGALAFTYCQVPVIYQMADEERLEVVFNDGASKTMDSLCMDPATSRQVFDRTGQVSRIFVRIKKTELR